MHASCQTCVEGTAVEELLQVPQAFYFEFFRAALYDFAIERLEEAVG
jgi:hypothetical protein